MKKALLIIISLAVLFFLSSRIWKDLQTYRLLTSEVENLEQTKANMEEEKEKLAALLTEKDQEGTLEDKARSMLGFKKSGEEVIMVLAPDGTTLVGTSTAETTVAPDIGKSESLFVRFSRVWYNFLDWLQN